MEAKKPFVPSIKKALTKTLFKLENNTAYYLRVDGAIFTGKKIDSGKTKDMEPAELMHVTNLETGEEGQIIVPAVLGKILREECPNDSYVGKGFEIVKFRDTGARYSTFNVAELELPAEYLPDAPVAGKGGAKGK